MEIIIGILLFEAAEMKLDEKEVIEFLRIFREGLKYCDGKEELISIIDMILLKLIF